MNESLGKINLLYEHGIFATCDILELYQFPGGYGGVCCFEELNKETYKFLRATKSNGQYQSFHYERIN